ncbi:MAG: hypothetical protein LBR40_04535 [Bacilli bacterium]|jgi:metal-responsive CopG/Arc/MetJ family transcriptional regulator|nr:hypothetical protein [Bacilli bacterium]
MAKILISISDDKLKKLDDISKRGYDGNRSRAIVELSRKVVELEEEKALLKKKYLDKI